MLDLSPSCLPSSHETSLEANKWAIIRESTSFDLKANPKGAVAFPSGEYVFVVELRPREMALWQQGHPEHAVKVPVKDTYDRLTVRYISWSKNSPLVEYSGELYQPCPNHPNRCTVASCGFMHSRQKQGRNAAQLHFELLCKNCSCVVNSG